MGDLLQGYSINLYKFKDQAKQTKMFVRENPGGQIKVHQAGRESIFFPNFQTQTKFVKGTIQ